MRRLTTDKVNRFHSFVIARAQKRGLTIGDLEEQTAYYRQFIYQVSSKEVLKNRRKRLKELAVILREPDGKLFFLAGINPWANRMSYHAQELLWEFVERTVTSYEQGGSGLTSETYDKYRRQIFSADETITKNVGNGK